MSTYPEVPKDSIEVAPEPVWYGSDPAAPAAMFVAVVAVETAPETIDPKIEVSHVGFE